MDFRIVYFTTFNRYVHMFQIFINIRCSGIHNKMKVMIFGEVRNKIVLHSNEGNVRREEFCGIGASAAGLVYFYVLSWLHGHCWNLVLLIAELFFNFLP